MSRGLYPLSLTLAISLPGIAGALGLGDIHVDSALNEPLSAEIQIVGATDDELTELRAAVANRETFQRYGVDRPPFLSSATFKVTRDSQGRPILAVHSGEAFTDPLVSLLVDLRWNHGELIREYSLLLDPSGLADARRASDISVADASFAPESSAAPAPASTAPASTAPASTAAAPTDGTIAPHRIAARDTLRAIVRRAGARSESSAQRMMIAIFHSSPGAFDGNINRLHKGAVLNMPGPAALAAINLVDARREVQSQMAAWRGTAQLAGRSHPSKAASIAGAAAMGGAQLPPELPQNAPVNEPDREPTVLLDQRVQTLEQALGDLKGLLAVEHAKLLSIQQQTSIAATASPQPAAAAPAPNAVRSRLVPIAAGLGILMAGFAVGRLRRADRVVHAKNSQPVDDKSMQSTAPADSAASGPSDSVSQAAAETDVHAQAADESQEQSISDTREQAISDAYALADSDATQLAPAAAEVPTVKTRHLVQDPSLETAVRKPPEPSSSRLARPPYGETTVNLALDTVVLGTNLVEHDTTAQHVQMPSVMNEHVVIAERRTNIVQVLKMAIEREPHRRDLRMKLLEVYYHTAATNRLAFLEIARKLSRERDQLSAADWDKIVVMGREVAADDALFAEQAGAKPLADCA
jgi:pilus assembly protein FimV